MDQELQIRPLVGDDSPALAMIEGHCPEAAHWGEQSYRRMGLDGLQGFAAVQGGDLSGFVLVRLVEDEMEILNLAVLPAARRRGFASRLLKEAIGRGRNSGAHRAYLEVRESNVAGRRFYSSHGFTEMGRRKAYYSQPVEDAIILVREIR